MAIRDLLSNSWARRQVPIRREGYSNPFRSLQQEMNRLFDNFFTDFTPARFGEGLGEYFPRVDVKETNDQVRVIAELPGMEEKDIDISISDDVLTLHGEKREEKEEKEGHFYRMERSYGAFHRDIPLPCEVQTDNAAAVFKKGVLTINIPKKPDAQRRARKIQIKVN